MKRRSVVDTQANRDMLNAIGEPFTVSSKKSKLYVKVSNANFTIIREIMPDDKPKQPKGE